MDQLVDHYQRMVEEAHAELSRARAARDAGVLAANAAWRAMKEAQHLAVWGWGVAVVTSAIGAIGWLR